MIDDLQIIDTYTVNLHVRPGDEGFTARATIELRPVARLAAQDTYRPVILPYTASTRPTPQEAVLAVVADVLAALGSGTSPLPPLCYERNQTQPEYMTPAEMSSLQADVTARWQSRSTRTEWQQHTRRALRGSGLGDDDLYLPLPFEDY